MHHFNNLKAAVYYWYTVHFLVFSTSDLQRNVTLKDWADFSGTFGSRASFKRTFFHFLSIYVDSEAIGRDRLGRSITKTFRLALCGSDSCFWFSSSRLGRWQSYLFSRLLINGRRQGYVLLVTGVFCGQLFRDLFSLSFVYNRLPSDHVGYVTGWK